MGLTKRIRYEVMRRDGHRCVYCGATATEARLTIDHVVAVALGGTDDIGNLVTACADCNAGKTSVNADEAFVAKVDEDTTRWQRAIAAAVRIRRDRGDELAEQMAQIDIAWRKWTYENGATVPLPDDWKTSVESLIVQGLPVDEMLSLIPIAMKAKTKAYLECSEFRYFIGCCKRVMREIEATARTLVEMQGVAVAAEVTAPEPEETVRIDPSTVQPTLDDL